MLCMSFEKWAKLGYWAKLAFYPTKNVGYLILAAHVKNLKKKLPKFVIFWTRQNKLRIYNPIILWVYSIIAFPGTLRKTIEFNWFDLAINICRYLYLVTKSRA